MNGDFLDDMVTISPTNVNIREQNAGGGFTTRNITTTNADNIPSASVIFPLFIPAHLALSE
jgi:hypothetical protein